MTLFQTLADFLCELVHAMPTELLARKSAAFRTFGPVQTWFHVDSLPGLYDVLEDQNINDRNLIM